ncbi:MAG TPA: SprT-like domain-containing protein [Microbacteriaceae bacterium]|nr:SprT-like domain-containing protein [Microbacteriaceae bacterium]
MSDLQRIETWAQALIRLHLDSSWSFGFDSAKRRVGACHYASRRITVSRYFVPLLDDDDIHQTLLHEVAHALCGPEAGHGSRWQSTARDLGYVGGTRHDGPAANAVAPWIGRCPNGHEVFRFRAPNRDTSCGKCARGFDRAFLLRWEYREITSAERRAARAG